MMKILKISAVLCLALGLGAGEAAAATHTFNWTWPTTRTDGSALALTAIGGIVICDISTPVPGGSCGSAGGGSGGTVVSCPATIPPTTATGTCTANVTSGHSFQAIVLDTASPQDASAPSNTVSIPLAAPSAITNLTVQ